MTERSVIIKIDFVSSASWRACPWPKLPTTAPNAGAPSGKAGRSRSGRTEATRAAILAAALDVFTESGFAAARMEAIAARAGVAKGTPYLHFAGKDALFEAIVAETLVPVLRDMAALEPGPHGADARLRRTHPARGVAPTPGRARRRRRPAGGRRGAPLPEARRSLLRRRGLARSRAVPDDRAPGGTRGEALRPDTGRFPHLLFAPALLGLLWGTMFARFEPLDAEAMIRVQLDLLFGPA